MANRRSTFLLKRSNVAGKKPSAGDLLLGELAINTADGILYTSGTTAGSILPIGWDRVAKTGDTMTGGLFTPYLSATTISAETITLKNYIDFNTGTTTPTNVSGRVFYDNQSHSLAYFPDINQNVKVEVGQQLYIIGYNNTGNIIPKGTVLSIQSATNGLPNFTPAVNIHSGNSQVIGLAASDILINGNGLALSQGILSGITINTFSVGDILYASPFSAGTYVADTNTFPFTARTNQIGYVIATGTTTGEIYVTINNEDENLTLTDIERNILEGNVISTGTYEFTGMTTASTTTFNIAPMRGWLVKNTYEYATLPDVINLIYTGGTNISLTNIASADSTYVLITSALTVTQQVTFPTPQQRRENIYLGKVNHPNRTSILNINNTVDYDVSPMSSLRDLWSPIKLINQGVIPSPNGANLSFNTSSGTLWGNGINWHNNQLNPNSVSISGKTPASFNYRTQTGGTSSSVTVIDPTKYDIGGVITSISPAGSNDATNQRIYLYPTGVINVLYGQTRYTTLAEAIAAIQSETFIPYPNAETNGILIGVISVRNDIVADGQPLTNPDYAKFTLVSKFGESFGGTGGLSTTTLQQAYNNSTNPEIITNSTLNGVQFRGGTGSDTAANIIIENNSGYQTGQWLANGTLSATTLQTGSLTANTTGVSATTISATTYFGLPTDIRVTGGTYSSGTATFTNNTGGTFTVTGFTTSPISVISGSSLFSTGLSNSGVGASGVTYSIFFGEGAGYQASAATQSTLLGNGAGFQATNANNSQFIGGNAGYQATGASYSTFIGNSAGYGAISSSNATFIGFNAGNAATNAGTSVFVGYYAGKDATSASSSVFIGQQAGQLATAANNSTFIGNNAGYQATAATNSSFMGYAAGYLATGANLSNFIGYNAGRIASGAYEATFIGHNAGSGATSASTSVFIGVNAGGGAIGGYMSNFIGNSAGQGATGASYSNLFGFKAGQAIDAGIGSNNTIIGTNISLPTATSNAINIGGVLFGTNTYSTITGNPLTGATSGGRIGIGIVNPLATLHVSGNTLIQGTLSATTISATTYLNLPSSTSGTTTGNGTTNYLARWTGSTSLSNSIIQDNGVGASIGTTPNNNYKLYTFSSTGTSIFAVGSTIGVLGQATNIALQGNGGTYGVYGNGVNDNGTIGVYGSAGDNGSPFTSSVFIGGKFLAGGTSGTNYGLQIQDGTEGVNKVLISTSTSGTTNWSSTLSGLTSVYANTLSATTINATTVSGDGSGLTNVTASLPYGLINAIATGNYLI